MLLCQSITKTDLLPELKAEVHCYAAESNGLCRYLLVLKQYMVSAVKLQNTRPYIHK
jgi:hypothetical protein